MRSSALFGTLLRLTIGRWPRATRRLAVATIGIASLVMPRGLAAQAVPSFAIIVHPSNAVEELRRSEVRDFFLRRRTEWSPNAKAEPVDLAPKLPVRSQFSRDVLGLSTTAVTNYWMQEIFGGGKTPPSVMSSVSAAVSYVAATPGAIAYVPRDAATDRVRVIRVIP